MGVLQVALSLGVEHESQEQRVGREAQGVHVHLPHVYVEAGVRELSLHACLGTGIQPCQAVLAGQLHVPLALFDHGIQHDAVQVPCGVAQVVHVALCLHAGGGGEEVGASAGEGGQGGERVQRVVGQEVAQVQLVGAQSGLVAHVFGIEASFQVGCAAMLAQQGIHVIDAAPHPCLGRECHGGQAEGVAPDETVHARQVGTLQVHREVGCPLPERVGQMGGPSAGFHVDHAGHGEAERVCPQAVDVTFEPEAGLQWLVGADASQQRARGAVGGQ